MELRKRLLRPGPGEKIPAVLLGGLTQLKMHWIRTANQGWISFPCWECETCPNCPGDPDKTVFPWYGAAACFETRIVEPTEEQRQRYELGRRAGEKRTPPIWRSIRTITQLALAEIADSEIHILANRESRGTVLEWSKGKARGAKVKVVVIDDYWPGLIDEFDWIPAAEKILNGGHPFRFAEPEAMDDGMIIKFRKQA